MVAGSVAGQLHRSSISRAVQSAIEDLRAGRPVVLVGTGDCAESGELVFAASAATPRLVSFVVRETSGLVCVAMPESECDRLDLPPMCPSWRRSRRVPFAVSVDAKADIGTGISARDRARTIRLLAARSTDPGDLTRPGHVLPLRAGDGGVAEEYSVAEGAVELVRMAGLGYAAGLSTIVSAVDDRNLARLPELLSFAHRHGLRIVRLAEIIQARARRPSAVEDQAGAVAAAHAASA